MTLSCTVKAIPEPEIEWAWNGYEIRNGSLGQVGSTVFTVDEWATPEYKISNLSILHADVVDHGGEYTCTGYNRAGHVTASIQLTMLRGINFIIRLQIYTTYYLNAGSTFVEICRQKANFYNKWSTTPTS